MSDVFMLGTLNQDVTYWAPGDPDITGNITYDAPISICGRWEDRTELNRDDQGVEFMSSSIVFVDRDLLVEGYIFLGISVVSDPQTLPDAREIRSLRKVPTISSCEFERRVVL